VIEFDDGFIDNTNILSEQEKQFFDFARDVIPVELYFSSDRNFNEFTYEIVYGSSKLEDNSYNIFEVQRLLDVGVAAKQKTKEETLMIENIKMSNDYIIDLIKSDIKGIDLRTIKDIHSLNAIGLLKNENAIGQVRHNVVFISGTDYKPIDNPFLLEEKMRRIIDNTNKIEHPIESAIYLHNNLSYLQYFEDVNKRTARTAMMFRMMQDRYFPILFGLMDVIDYKTSLANYYETGSHKEFVQVFVDAYKKMTEQYKLSVEQVKEVKQQAKHRFGM
jgi:possible cell division protein